MEEDDDDEEILHYYIRVIYLSRCNSRQWATASSLSRIYDHTQTHHISMTPLDMWSARHRDLYLSRNNTYNRQTSILKGGIRTRKPSKRAAAEPRFSPRAHRYLMVIMIRLSIKWHPKIQNSYFITYRALYRNRTHSTARPALCWCRRRFVP